MPPVVRTIYYTVGWFVSNTVVHQYSGPITISSDVLLKAKAFKNNANPSSVSSAWFAKTSAFRFSLSNSSNVSVIAGLQSATRSTQHWQAAALSQCYSLCRGCHRGLVVPSRLRRAIRSCSTILAISDQRINPGRQFHGYCDLDRWRRNQNHGFYPERGRSSCVDRGNTDNHA